jgi:hypothetical protein
LSFSEQSLNINISILTSISVNVSFNNVSLATVRKVSDKLLVVEGDGVEVTSGRFGGDFQGEVFSGDVAVVVLEESSKAVPRRGLSVFVPVDNARDDRVTSVVQAGIIEDLEPCHQDRGGWRRCGWSLEFERELP